MKILAALALLIATAVGVFSYAPHAQAQGCGAGNPNCIAPTPPTTPSCDNSNRIATTAFVGACGGGGGGGGSPGGSIGAVQYKAGGALFGGTNISNNSVLVTDGSGNPSESTALPNGITATTQTGGDSSTKIATDAFVAAAIPALPLSTGNGGLGASFSAASGVLQFSAGVASASAALANGTTATTQTSTDNTTKIATDAFVQSVLSGVAVTSVFGRTGAVVATTGDYTFSQIGSTPTTVAGYGITNALVTTNNLSDLNNAATARTNLGLGTFATQNFTTPPAIGGGTPNTGAFTTLSTTSTVNIVNGPFQFNGNAITLPSSIATLSFQSGTWTPGDCLQVAAGAPGIAGAIADAGSVCGSGGGGGGGSTAHTQDFLAGTNFTPGTTTTLTLSSIPFSAASLAVAFDGVAQAHNTWSINLLTGVVTFNAAIPNSVQVVEAQWLSASLTSGTVSSVSVVSANGFDGTVATPTTTPAITLTTSISGYLQGNGTALQVATATANTFLGNITGTTGNVTANSLPTCSDTGGQHWNYAPVTGIFCGSSIGNAITALTGDVTATGPGSVAGTISGNAVTYAKMQQVTGQRLLGNSSGSTANVGEINLGTTLTFAAGALQTAAITGDVTASANSFSTVVGKIQTIAVKSGTPTDGTVLTYVAANSDWEPIAAPAGNVPVGGTAGQVLAKIDATNFNTQWITVAGSGTVTSITAGTGLSGGTITTTGTIALSVPVVASNGGTGNTSNTAHGVMVGAGSSNLSVTAAGTAGQVLISGGASADPSYGGKQLVRTVRRTVTSGASDTATAADFIIAWDKASGSASTENIPACASGIDGTMYVVVDEKGDAGTNNITVTPASGTILGTTSLVMNINLSSITLQCDSSTTNWVVE